LERLVLVPLAEEHQSTRLHIHKPEYDPEGINLILVIALLGGDLLPRYVIQRAVAQGGFPCLGLVALPAGQTASLQVGAAPN
jgi:hypothetical protein